MSLAKQRKGSYKVNKQENRSLDICVIGAGIAGICAGVKLKTSLGITNFTIFDENHEVGGTWLLHTYPKCSCDVPTHLYSYSFEQNPGWSANFCTQKEMLEYFKSVATKYELYSNLKFNRQVRKLSWNGETNKWNVAVFNKTTETLDEFVFDIVIAGPGGLRVPKIPDKFVNFKGPMMHSAKWDSNVNLDGKVVAVVGSGTSAVQIIPGIVYKVKTLYSFQRRPPWVVPRPQFRYTERTQKAFRNIPGLQSCWRTSLFWTLEAGFSMFKKDSWMNSLGARIGKAHLNRQLAERPDLRELLLPDYKFACKRLCPSNEFYPVMALSKVKIIRDDIAEVKDHSIITEDGQEHKIDVLILATGYDTNDYFAPVDLTGSNSENILDIWRSNRPEHYLGVVNHSAPNLFFLLGPNSGFPYTTNIFPIECQVNWTMKVIRKMISKGAAAVRVTKCAQENYMNKLTREMKKTVYGAYDCGSWFANERGFITGVYSNTLVSYWRKTRKVDSSKLEFIYT